MSLTGSSGRSDLLLRRANYIELLRALRRTAHYNPETIEALERILPEAAAEAATQKRWASGIRALPDFSQRQNHAA